MILPPLVFPGKNTSLIVLGVRDEESKFCDNDARTKPGEVTDKKFELDFTGPKKLNVIWSLLRPQLSQSEAGNCIFS